MKILTLGARLILGLVFLIFGLNHIYTFIHMPTPTGDAGAMGTLMFVHGWFRVYGAAEAACGLLLIGGRFVPLALTILAGIGLNILLYGLTLDSNGLYLPLFLAILEVILVYAYRESFRGIFDPKAEPHWK
jgi:putative oxidoreductase